MLNLLSLKFWFAVSPVPLRAVSFKLLLGAFLAFILVGAIGKIIAKNKRKNFVMSRTASKLGRPFISTGIIGLILLFFESQRISFLSSRFWYVILSVWFIYAMVRFFQYIFIKLPREQGELEKKTRINKYLPR